MACELGDVDHRHEVWTKAYTTLLQQQDQQVQPGRRGMATFLRDEVLERPDRLARVAEDQYGTA